MVTFKRAYGDFGEDLACQVLKKNKYKILTRNFSDKDGEIDIIAIETKASRKRSEDYDKMSDMIKNEDVLVFVEVKARHSTLYGEPFEAVDKPKQARYYTLANRYIAKNNLSDYQYRFDIIEILENQVVNHYKNAF